MRSLVTGATGFIGRRLVRRLIETDGADAVACLVKPPATPLEAEALAFLRGRGVRLIDGDLVDPAVTAEAPPTVDRVFHLAANIDTAAAERDLLVNDRGTAHLIDWLRPAARGVRILYASSVAVHDRGGEPDGPIAEESPFVPRTLYGVTKLRGESILRERAADRGYTWTILRLPTVYGPGQKPGGLFDTMINLGASGGLLGRIDWPGRTSIIHVDDAAALMIDLSARGDAANQVFCVASDESLTVGDISRIVAGAVGRRVTPIAIPAPLLWLVRRLVWNRALAAAMPAFARVSFWRLSLIVSDGFWFDTAKLRRVYRAPIRPLEQGLADVLDGDSRVKSQSRTEH